MAINTEYSRLLIKRSTVAGVIPTIPTGTTIDNTWLTTDIMVGEMFANVADDRLWLRTDNGLFEIIQTGSTDTNWYTTGATLVGNTVYFDRNDMLSAYSVDLSSISLTGDYLPTSGGTLTGDLIINTNLTVDGDTEIQKLSASTISILNSGATSVQFADYSGNIIRTGVTNSSIVAGSNNIINSGLSNVLVAGSSITASTSDTAYVTKLNIGNVPAGTSINNLGVDASGNVIIGTAPSGSTNTSGWSADTTYPTSVYQNNSTGNAIVANYALAANSGTTAQGAASAAFGEGSAAKGQGAFAIGKSTLAGASYSFTHGDTNEVKSTATNAAILGGRSHTINGSSEDSAIIGGTGNTIQAGVQRTIVLGGKDIAVDRDDTVYVPALVITDYAGGTANRFLGLDASNQVVTASTSSIGVGTFLPLTGGTMTGDLLLNPTVTIESSVSGQTILMDYNDNSVPSIKLQNNSGYQVVVGENVRLVGDGAELQVTDTVDVTSGFYLSNAGGGYLSTRSNKILNINTDVSNSGDVVIGHSGNKLRFATNLNSGSTASVLTLNSNGYVITASTSSIGAGVYLPLTGGSMTGNVSALGLTATTFSATTYQGVPMDLSFAISDETTAITSGTSKLTIYAPYAFTITSVKASLSTSGSTSSQFDVNVEGSSIFSTNPTIDANEFSTSTAAVPSVISASTVTTDQKITIDIDSAGTGAKGAKIYILGKRNS